MCTSIPSIFWILCVSLEIIATVRDKNTYQMLCILNLTWPCRHVIFVSHFCIDNFFDDLRDSAVSDIAKKQSLILCKWYVRIRSSVISKDKASLFNSLMNCSFQCYDVHVCAANFQVSAQSGLLIFTLTHMYSIYPFQNDVPSSSSSSTFIFHVILLNQCYLFRSKMRISFYITFYYKRQSSFFTKYLTFRHTLRNTLPDLLLAVVSRHRSTRSTIIGHLSRVVLESV